MDTSGRIFDVEEERKWFEAEKVDPAAAEAKLAEAQARLDGYLRGRAEGDAPNRAARRAAEKAARRG